MTGRGRPVDPERVDAAGGSALPLDEAHDLAALLKLLADPIRLRILTGLDATEEMCVGDVALALDASEDSTSHGLRRLRAAGLLQRRREGHLGYYRLRDIPLRSGLADALDQLRALTGCHREQSADEQQ